ncbi:MAG: TAXI family TRAP transporter solute-binding subunit [Acidaminococcales bacterium]|jgi:TRAP transporter TAXI family solute receptor|nr:TAXI family TRAP transporter solute-binding subunit [Acidaminococcales bacterium]
MKRQTLLALAVLFTVSLFLAACGAPAKPAPAAENNARPAAGGKSGGQRLIIASGPIGGAFYPIAGGIAALINENVKGVSVSVQVTGGGIENARLVGTGEADLGMSAADQTYHAYKHSGMFAKDNLSLKTLGTLHSSPQQIIVLKKSGIREFEDLKGKKVAIGEPGGGSEVAFKEVLKALGWKETDVRMIFLPYDQAMEQLGDGLLDAACVYAGMPAPTVTALATKMDVLMVNHSDALFEKLAKVTPLYASETIPAGSYKGMDAAIKTPTQRIMFTCSDKLSPDLAYQITKAVYGNLGKLAAFHSAVKSISLESAPKTTAPLNDGAKKYYSEAGVIK